MKKSCKLLIGFFLVTSAYAMDSEYTMPSKQVIYARLTSGETCFDEHDLEADNLATILAGKQLSYRQIESRVHGAITGHVAYLKQALVDIEPDSSLLRVTPQWQQKVLAVILQDCKQLACEPR